MFMQCGIKWSVERFVCQEWWTALFPAAPPARVASAMTVVCVRTPTVLLLGVTPHHLSCTLTSRSPLLITRMA